MSARPRSDARLSARKAEVRRAEGRRRLRALIALLSTGALVGGGLFLLHSPLLSARAVTVTGAVHESTAQVLDVSGLDRAPPLIDLDAAHAAAAVEGLPWVKAARVSRHWPDGASVAVVERVPLAEAPIGGGRFAVLDGSGRVLEVTTAKPAGLVPVAPVGPVPAPGGFLPAADRPLVAVARSVPLSLLGRLGVVRRGGGGVELDLTGGPVVELGTATELAQKMVSLMTVLDDPAISGLSRIDLEVAAAPVLTP